jgi:hypothetical protein
MTNEQLVDALDTVLQRDADALAAHLLQRCGTPRIALALLGVTANHLLAKLPGPKRRKLLADFLDAFEPCDHDRSAA